MSLKSLWCPPLKPKSSNYLCTWLWGEVHTFAGSITKGESINYAGQTLLNSSLTTRTWSDPSLLFSTAVTVYIINLSTNHIPLCGISSVSCILVVIELTEYLSCLELSCKLLMLFISLSKCLRVLGTLLSGLIQCIYCSKNPSLIPPVKCLLNPSECLLLFTVEGTQ